MNKSRRKELASVINRIDDLKSELEQIKDAEQEYLDNMPENLLESERAQSSYSAITEMENAFDSLDDALTSLQNIQ